MPTIRVVFCYNPKTRLVMEAVQAYVHSLQMVDFESWNEDLFVELKKSRKVKGHFAARKTPFCGVFVNDKAVKGFYTEADQCTAEDINKFIHSLVDKELDSSIEARVASQDDIITVKSINHD